MAMLTALYELAERKGLLEDTAFEKRSVSYVIVLDAAGQVLNVESALDEAGKPRGMLAPRAPEGKTSGIKSAFLVDNVQYVLGAPKLEKETREANPPGGTRSRGEEVQAKEDRARDRSAKAFADFLRIIEKANDQTKDAGLQAVHEFLKDVGARGEAVRAMVARHSDSVSATSKKGAKKKGARKGAKAPEPDRPTEGGAVARWDWTGAEVLAFRLASDDGRLLHQREAVAAWWRKEADAAVEGEVGRCLVTGEFAPSVRLHPKLKLVPEALRSGSFLVSFNSDAFASWGRDQGANAGVSKRGSEGYGCAINWLLERQGQRRFRQGVLVSKDSVLMFWSRPPEGTPLSEEDDLAASLPDLLGTDGPGREADPEEYRRSVEAVWRGLAVGPRDADTRFYALTLAGAAARAVVRDWFESTAEVVKGNVCAWFDALRVGSLEGVGERDRPPSLRALLSAMLTRPGAEGDQGGLSAALAARLARCALYGDRIPLEVLRAALARFRLPAGAQRLRAGLIKAALLRPGWTDKRWEVSVALDEESREVPYVLGRVFSLLEALQGRAQGDLNATIRDKFFASASATPASVFGTLLQRAQHHIAKLEGAPDFDLGKVLDLLPGRAFPKVLTTEEQGLFALGYYHQREHGIRRAMERKAEKDAKAAAKAAALEEKKGT
ncbi:MAG: type I-C CRISPR-associated protein Cas8c/Csd1 [Deltaproteobacteria bacterium]|nr:type I-C CRISPR-associated protein Cas8c/Csd1 [Deltaproteobacteria bacterium]